VTKIKLQQKLKGSKFIAVHCKGAIDSFYKALDSVSPAKRKSFERAIILQIQRLLELQIQRLLDGHRLSKENFPQEGNLPVKKGQSKAKKFNAFKRIPIRGYCWLSETHQNTYFISHYVYKDQVKLKDKDTLRVGNNWNRIEVNGDEC